MNSDKIADKLGISRNHAALVGSKFICNGKGNDWDFLVVVDEDKVRKLGFQPDLDCELYPSEFKSFRNGDVNLIVTQSYSYFCSEYAIACAAKVLFNGFKYSMKDRNGRVEFHGLVRDTIAERIEEFPF